MTNLPLSQPCWAGFWPYQAQGISYLNHGSFGSVPIPVRQAEDKLRENLRANPMAALVFDHGGLLCEAGRGLMEDNRRFLAGLVGAEAEGFVLTQGATESVNIVLKSLALRGYFAPGDEILVTSQGYNACTNAVREVAALTGAVMVTAELPFPFEAPEQVIEAILAAVSDKTKFALIDHITSLPGYILPIKAIVEGLQARGVPVLVDGAHALFQVDLDLAALGADFYVGNCHKWFCAPLGAGFLAVAERWRCDIRPLLTSHAYNDTSTSLSPFVKAFSWTGTRDYSAFFVMKDCADFLTSLAGGWQALRARNHALALYGQKIISAAVGSALPVPELMLGSMAPVVLPDGDALALRDILWRQHRIITQLPAWPAPGQRLLRLSAHAYNQPEEYERLAEILPKYL